MNALRVFVALVILLSASQCAKAVTPSLPSPHFYVYELVLKIGRERVPTGTAFKTAKLCHDAAVEENRRTNSLARFECEPLIVLKE